MHQFVLILHVLGACVWVGGHFYLLIRLMPNFIRTNDVAGFLKFEKSYEPLGMAALLVQVITGIYMMNDIVPVGLWGEPMGFLTGLIHSKLTWLGLTIITAAHARFRIVARLQKGIGNERTLMLMGIHVGFICLWSVGFVVSGVLFRGW